jgi:hypothetical protein
MEPSEPSLEQDAVRIYTAAQYEAILGEESKWHDHSKEFEDVQGIFCLTNRAIELSKLMMVPFVVNVDHSTTYETFESASMVINGETILCDDKHHWIIRMFYLIHIPIHKGRNALSYSNVLQFVYYSGHVYSHKKKYSLNVQQFLNDAALHCYDSLIDVPRTLEGDWAHAFYSGCEVRYEQRDGKAVWQKLKHEFTHTTRMYPLTTHIQELTKMLIVPEDDPEMERVTLQIGDEVANYNAEPDHFIIQPLRISAQQMKENNGMISHVKLMQIAYNVGQLNIVMFHSLDGDYEAGEDPIWHFVRRHKLCSMMNPSHIKQGDLCGIDTYIVMVKN